MLTQKKGKQVRLYILEDDEANLDKLSQATGLDVTTIMTFLVSAGVKACAEAGYRLPLPLQFNISETVACWNEPRTPKTPGPPKSRCKYE